MRFIQCVAEPKANPPVLMTEGFVLGIFLVELGGFEPPTF